MSDFDQRLDDIEQHVKDGLITRREARRKIAALKALMAEANSPKK